MGLGVITLDALTRREWVKEDELAAEIKVHPKVLRRVLRYLEQVRRPLPRAALPSVPRSCRLGNTLNVHTGALANLQNSWMHINVLCFLKLACC